MRGGIQASVLSFLFWVLHSVDCDVLNGLWLVKVEELSYREVDKFSKFAEQFEEKLWLLCSHL